MKSGMVKRSTSFSGISGSSGIDGIFSILALSRDENNLTTARYMQDLGPDIVKMTALHLRRDSWSWLLYVEFGRGLSLAVTVAGCDYVKAFVLFGDMRNDERVASTLLKNTNVLALCEQVIYNEKERERKDVKLCKP